MPSPAPTVHPSPAPTVHPYMRRGDALDWGWVRSHGLGDADFRLELGAFLALWVAFVILVIVCVRRCNARRDALGYHIVGTVGARGVIQDPEDFDEVEDECPMGGAAAFEDRVPFSDSVRDTRVGNPLAAARSGGAVELTVRPRSRPPRGTRPHPRGPRFRRSTSRAGRGPGRARRRRLRRSAIKKFKE